MRHRRQRSSRFSCEQLAIAPMNDRAVGPVSTRNSIVALTPKRSIAIPAVGVGLTPVPGEVAAGAQHPGHAAFTAARTNRRSS